MNRRRSQEESASSALGGLMTCISGQALQRLANRLEQLTIRVDADEMSLKLLDDRIIVSLPSFNTVLSIDCHGMHHVLGETTRFHAWGELLNASILRPPMRDLYDGSQSMGNPMRKTVLSFLDSGASWQGIELPCGVVFYLWDFAVYDLRQ
jgi:hypothetical protein